mgnify:CR=1 FL=1
MMHPAFLAIWLLFLAYVFALELVVDPTMQRPGLWIAAVVWFVVAETVGGIRRHRGDMLSEAVWTFNDGKWGRRVFAGALGIYFALRLFMLGGFGGLPYWLPRATLVTGFGVWLTVHFWSRGASA